MSKSRDIADSAATINFIDGVTSAVQAQLNTLSTALNNISVTSGTLTQTFTNGQETTISLTSTVLAPVVTVTKEVPQTGVTNNTWDVSSTAENYTRLDSAPATTLDWVALGFDISSAAFVDSFSVSAQDTAPMGLAFNPDGSKMYMVGRSTPSVYQYALSTNFDTSSASYTQSFSVASQENEPQEVAFNTAGTRMYVVARNQSQAVLEYVLTTGFDISSATYNQSFSVTAQDGSPHGLTFNSDGSKMFVVGVTNDTVYEYAVSTPLDISSASFTRSFSVASQDLIPNGIRFNGDGTKMFIVGATNDSVYQYALSTGFDISSTSYTQTFSVTTQDTDPQAIAFNTDGTKMFILGAAGDTVDEYALGLLELTLGTGSFASADVGKTIEANSGVFVLTATTGTYVETTTPTSYAQAASGAWGMFGVVYNTVDGDLELSGLQTGLFDVSTAVFVQNFSVASQDSEPSGIAFNTDGTKMFIVGNGNNSVFEYTLSTGGDVSSATYSQSFSVGSQDTEPQGIAFNANGTKMFIVGGIGQDINEYTLSTGFDVSTSSFVDSFSVSGQETQPYGIAFKTDGTKMFVVGHTGDDVNEYALSTGFDVSTASFTDSFSIAAQETSPTGLAFNSDGTKMFIVGSAGDDVNEYALTAGFDVSTASFTDSFSIAAQETLPSGLAFNTSGSKMFVLGNTGDDVNEYSVGVTATPTGYQPVHTTASTATTYWTDINSMTADQAAGDGNVYYAISTDDRTTWSVIKDVGGERDIVRNNAGTWQYNSNGTYASETWAAGTTNTELATLAQAMEGASNLAGAFDVSTSVYSQNFSIAAQEGTPESIAFNTDGTKMFVVGSTGQDVNEYALTTGFDVSTASFTDAFSVSGQDTAPNGLAFNADGTKMFVVGSTGVDVNEYALSTGFDVSTTSFTDAFSVSAQITTPRGIAFSANGIKMLVLGATDVYEYTLSTGFDVSTASFVDNFDLSAQDAQFRGFGCNTDGTKIYIIGDSNNSVFQYALSTGFDVSTTSFTASFSVASQESNPRGIAFNIDGTKMFIAGRTTNDAVYEYNLGSTSYTNQMDKTQLDAVTDPNHIALSNDLDLAIVLNLTSGTTVPSSNGVAINYDANVLNSGAILGTDYNYDAPAQNKVRITALAANNLKIRVL